MRRKKTQILIIKINGKELSITQFRSKKLKFIRIETAQKLL